MPEHPAHREVRSRLPAPLAALVAAGLAGAMAVGCGSGQGSSSSPGPSRTSVHRSGSRPNPSSARPGRASRSADAPPGAGPSPPVVPPTRAAAAVSRLIPLGLPVYCGGPRGRYVALTFDDGPGPYTHLALRKLRFFHDRATFFLVGRVLPVDPAAPRQETQVGTVADHTWTHPVLPALSADQVRHEIASAQAAVARASGSPVTLFRPPYGARTPAIDRQARALGLLEVLWSVDSRDSAGANYAGISANVISGLRPGAIILMHENRGQTIRALLTILPALRRRHLRAVTVPELLALDPPSTRQLREGGAGCARSSSSSASLTGGG